MSNHSDFVFGTMQNSIDSMQLSGEAMRLPEENARLRQENAQLKRDNAQLQVILLSYKRDNAQLQGDNQKVDSDRKLVGNSMFKHFYFYRHIFLFCLERD